MNGYFMIPLTGGMNIVDETSPIQEATDTITDVADKVTSFQITDYLPVVLNWGFKILVVLLIWFVGKQLSRFFVHVFQRMSEKNNLDQSVAGFLGHLITWLMYLLIFSTILNYLNIGTASLVAVLGSAGLAIGLSLQGSLANFAGSIILLIMKPFRVGDFISTSFGDGTVTMIGLIYTIITTVDNKQISIPNGALANSNIINATANPTRGIAVAVDVSYESDIKKAKSLIEKLLRDSAYRIPDADVKVFVKSLGESSIVIEGRTSVKTEDYWDAIWSTQEEIKSVYDAEGIEIPYNQLDVHMK